jgi:hypothetical protein
MDTQLESKEAPGLESMQAWFRRMSTYWIIALLLLFLATGFLTLRYYGLTWDEGLGNLFFGERYFRYFLSFNQNFLDFKADLPVLQQNTLHLFQSPFRGTPSEFPAVADTLSAASMYLFSYKLGWVNPIEGFHAFTVLLATLFLGVLYGFAAPRMGKFAALMAMLFLGTFPRFWADMHFNVKDVPEAIFFSLVIIAYLPWYERPTIWKAGLIGVLWGLALGIKANALFVPIILLGGLLPWSLRWQDWRDLISHLRLRLLHYVGMAASAMVVYLISWPYLYEHPVANLKAYWTYIFDQGGRMGTAAWSIDPLRQVVTTMPELMLAALGVGLVFVTLRTWRGKQPFARILLVWLVFPILRASAPGAVNFDGIRHFMEFIPAAALIAGYGVSQLVASIFPHRRGVFAARAAAVTLLCASTLLIGQTYYPYLHIYYNQLSGGLYGARNGWLGADAADYWVSSYRQGMEWLSQNAPQGSSVHPMIAGWVVDLSAPVFLRSDIRVMSGDPLPDFSVLEQSDTPIYLMFNTRNGGQLDELAYCQQRKTPVYEIDVDRVPILLIYQFGKSLPQLPG